METLQPFAYRDAREGHEVLDLETRSLLQAMFSLLMELTRLDLQGKPGDRPVLTLPISR